LRPAGAIAAYVELHIEQGPVLERERVPIGVVTGYPGIWRLAVRLVGRAAHSGTTPMDTRRDALAAAAEVVLAVEAAGRSAGPGVVATVGRLDVSPNAANAVPGRVELVAELRAPDEPTLARLADTVAARARAIAAARGVEAGVEPLSRGRPGRTDPTVVAAIERAAAARGLACRRLASGAGHDALHVGRVAPAGMIFVPCRDGISHHPDEWADPADVAAGALVLAGALLELDR
jgi:N-carbamoyl-L-amino-acid hydrolase